MKRIMRAGAAAALCAFALSACIVIPKSRDEYRNRSAYEIQKLTFTVPRSLDAVVASLSRQFEVCGMSGQQLVQTRQYQDIYTSTMTIKKVSPSTAELEYRTSQSRTIGEPEGGQFTYVADFEANGARSTVATFYHAGEWQKTLTNALRKWVEGDVSSCHGVGLKQ